MNDFFNEVFTLKWWLGVVLVGIILNILSSYLHRWLDKLRGNFSESFKKKNEKKKIDREKQIDHLLKNPSEKYFLALDEIRYRIRSFTFNFFGFMFIYLSRLIASTLYLNLLEETIILIIGLILALFSFILALQDHRIVMKNASPLKEVRSKVD